MSYLPRGSGLAWNTMLRDCGVIPKCPHCEATNVQRIHKNQITCGKMACRELQNRATKRASLDKAKAKRDRLKLIAGQENGTD